MTDLDADEFLSFARSPGCSSPLSISLRAPPSPHSSRSSSPDLYTPLPTLSTAHFARFFKNCAVSPTLSGISEEMVLQDLSQQAPSKAPTNKGKAIDYFGALPELPKPTFEFDEPEIVPQLDSVRSTLKARSMTTGCLNAPKRESSVKAYIPLGHPAAVPKENSELHATLTTENYMLPESPADGQADTFITAPPSPNRREMDGSYDIPVFSPDITIHDFPRLPDELRGPCPEISPRTSVPKSQLEDLPNTAKFLSMNIGDAFMDPTVILEPLDAVPDPLEQADGPVPAPIHVPAPVPATVPDVAKTTGAAPELPNPLDKHVNRKDKALKKFRKKVRKCRKVCLRTPVLVVIVGSELAGPTKMALDKIGSGLPSGLGEPPSVPIQIPASVSAPLAMAAPSSFPQRQRQMPPRLKSKFTKIEEALAGHGGSFIGYEGKLVGPEGKLVGSNRKLVEHGWKKPACCEDMET